MADSASQQVMLEGIRCYHPEKAHGCADYPAEGFHVLLQVEEGHFWFESRNRMLHCLINRYLCTRDRRRQFLEIGCGTGFVLRMLSKMPNLMVSGSEIHLTGAQVAARRVPGVEVFQLDALEMEFQEIYDAIGLFDVIEHVEADDDLLRRAHRALKPNGLIFITVPQYPSLWSAQDSAAGHKRRYTRSELRNKALQAGFDVLCASSLFCATFPLYAFSRHRQQRSTPDAAANQAAVELALPPWQNRLLTLLCQLDLFILRLGLPLPFGSSLVLVGRRRN